MVNNLQVSGYKVILNRVGSAPLNRCTVTSITAGHPITTPVEGGANSIPVKKLLTPQVSGGFGVGAGHLVRDSGDG
ncbi:MAG TPA: hypothetical protein VLL82_16465 [Mycobacterium sp.]|nr:hypothetical protein [Mycobacterium sp.]